MKILVTGSSGTVGTGLCLALLARGHEVIGLDRNPNPFDPGVESRTLRCDLTDEVAVRQCFPGDCEMVVHLAAHARVPHSIKDPSQARNNFVATFNVLEEARKCGIRRFVFSSSKDVYGNLKVVNAEDDVRIEACESPYAASKIGCEALLQSYSRCFGVRFVIARLSNVYGPFSELDRVIPIFVRLTREGKDLTVKGANKRLDYIHLDDAVEGLSLCVERFDEVPDQVFNIASGEGVSLSLLAREIRNILGGSNAIREEDAEPGDVLESICEVRKAEELLGFRASTTFSDGIRRTVPYYLS